MALHVLSATAAILGTDLGGDKLALGLPRVRGSRTRRATIDGWLSRDRGASIAQTAPHGARASQLGKNPEKPAPESDGRRPEGPGEALKISRKY